MNFRNLVDTKLILIAGELEIVAMIYGFVADGLSIIVIKPSVFSGKLKLSEGNISAPEGKPGAIEGKPGASSGKLVLPDDAPSILYYKSTI